MKRVYTATALLFTLLLGCIFFYQQLSVTTTQLSSRLDAVYQTYPNTQSQTQVEQIYTDWVQSKKWLGLVLAHDELEEIEQHFSRLREAIVVEAEQEVFITLRQLSDFITHLHAMQQPTLENVF